MNKIFISLVVVMVVIAGLLMFQAKQAGTSIVLTPSELNERISSNQVPVNSLDRIRVVGRIAADQPIHYQTEPFAELSFGIHNPGSNDGKIVSVVYRGLRPDMFAAGRDVIIDGGYRDGKLVASSLLTQCPSKYEAPSPEKKYNVPVASEPAPS